MMLVSQIGFKPGETVTIELSASLVVDGTIEWCEDGLCGVQFHDPIASDQFLESMAAEKREGRRRTQRLAVQRRATSYSECGIRPVTITDVSPRGVGLSHDGSLRTGVFVKLVLESGTTRAGAVCWSRDGHAGVLLVEPFTQAELESAGGL